MQKISASIMLTSFLVNAVSPGPAYGSLKEDRPEARSPVPKMCPAAYSVKTFETRAFDATDVDVRRTAARGFQWYPWNFFSGFQQKDRETLNSDGTISAEGVSGPNGGMASAAVTKEPPYFVGTAFGGGFCVQAEISFDPSLVNTKAGWPSFWGMSIEHLIQRGAAQWPNQKPGYEHFIEADFMEYYRLPPPQYLASLIDWYGAFNSSCYPKSFCKVASSVTNLPNAVQSSTDWRNTWHRVAAVWTPATLKHAGSMQYFFDDRPLGAPLIWTICPHSFAPPPSAQSRFCIIDQQHLTLLFGSNTSAITVRSVVVYQASAAHNISN